MPVEVVLVDSADLEQVISFQDGNVIAEHVVFAVPETGTGLLSVYVIRNESLQLGFAALDFQRPAQPRAKRATLNGVTLAGPRPPVAQKAIVEVVGHVGADVRGHSCDQI